METDTRDVFVCHASEDKEKIVKPIVEGFSKAGITCWYDNAEIRWGDSITAKVNEGLRISQYVMVILSPAFIEKKWPQREFNAALNIESSEGEVKVLPLLVGTAKEKSDILKMYPLLNDKRYLSWDGKIHNIIDAIRERLGRPVTTVLDSLRSGLERKIMLPKIRKQFTQRDKDMYLRDSLFVIREYFRTALSEISNHYNEIETDIYEVHNYKFICTVYMNGEISNKCKIWIGGLSSSDAVAYQEGQINIDNDNSYNDMLNVKEHNNSLCLSPSGMWFGSSRHSDKEYFSSEEAAEYLWARFTDRLKD